MRDFDCFRLGGFSEIDQRDFMKVAERDFKANSSACVGFIEEMRKRDMKKQ